MYIIDAMKYHLHSVTIEILGIILIASVAYALSLNLALAASVNANVNVQCPFTIKLNTNSVYHLNATYQSANFTIKADANCSILNMSGTFSILNQTGNQVYSMPINGISVNNNTTLHKFYFDTSELPSGNYTSKLAMSFANLINSSNSTFLVEKPSSIKILNFSTPASIPIGSMQYFNIELKNIGYPSISSNAFVNSYINITGPRNSSLQITLQSMPPSQSVNITAQTFNTSEMPGTYSARLYIEYVSDNIIKNASSSIKYIVTSPSPTRPSPAVVAITKRPGFSLISFPFIISMINGTSKTYSINIKNTVNYTEYASFVVPKYYADILNFAAYNVSLPPGQTIGLSLLFTAKANIKSGQYQIPMNISVSSRTANVSETVYTTLNIVNAAVPITTSSIELENNTNNMQGTIKIVNPSSMNLTGIVAKTIIPYDITKNITSISAYGVPYKITRTNTGYSIDWYIGSVPANSTDYTYFSISNITNQDLLDHITELLYSPTAPLPSSILKIIDTNIPSFYAGHRNNITITAFYSGISQQTITEFLTGGAGVSISNPTKHINVTPNSAFTSTFEVDPHSPGTSIVGFSMNAEGTYVNESIPLMVLAPQVTSTIKTTTTIPARILPSALITNLKIYTFDITGILIIIAIVLISIKQKSRSAYKQERADKLKRMRETIKRAE